MPPASYSFEDLSGVQSGTFENPYDALIEACNNDPSYCDESLLCSVWLTYTSLRYKPVIPPTAPLAPLSKKPNYYHLISPG
ncbi:hypothetical protein LTR28_010402 [Elasticomyces elasticus]|nr:hypothetical protein LTR28_010402 [Elasticomyces elasticus]